MENLSFEQDNEFNENSFVKEHMKNFVDMVQKT